MSVLSWCHLFVPLPQQSEFAPLSITKNPLLGSLLRNAARRVHAAPLTRRRVLRSYLVRVGVTAYGKYR
jgi:hypothetical protein